MFTRHSFGSPEAFHHEDTPNVEGPRFRYAARPPLSVAISSNRESSAGGKLSEYAQASYYSDSRDGPNSQGRLAGCREHSPR
jgi:hypothetical protein